MGPELWLALGLVASAGLLGVGYWLRGPAVALAKDEASDLGIELAREKAAHADLRARFNRYVGAVDSDAAEDRSAADAADRGDLDAWVLERAPGGGGGGSPPAEPTEAGHEG